MPQLPGNRERPQRMRDRHGLAKLPSARSSRRLLVENPIHIEMKSTQVLAPKKDRALIEAADIDVWSRPGVKRVGVAQADRRLRTLPGKHDHLHRSSNSPRLIPFANAAGCAMRIRKWTEHAQKLQPRRDGQLRDLVD
jgi:hypothetical protein